MEIKYHQHIGIYEKAVSNDLCDKFIKLYNNYPEMQQRRNINSGARDKQFFIHEFVNSKLISKEENEIAIEIVNEFNTVLERALLDYQYKYSTIVNEYGVLSPLGVYKIQKTLPTEGFHSFHIEQSIKDLNDFSRVLVYTLYLNDVEDGGETEFLEQLIRIKAKKGTLCIFPAGLTHPHRGNTPYTGEKYILTGWLFAKDILEKYGD